MICLVPVKIIQYSIDLIGGNETYIYNVAACLLIYHNERRDGLAGAPMNGQMDRLWADQ